MCPFLDRDAKEYMENWERNHKTKQCWLGLEKQERGFGVKQNNQQNAMML